MRVEHVEQRLAVGIAEADERAAGIGDGFGPERGPVAQALVVDAGDLGGASGKANPEAVIVFAGVQQRGEVNSIAHALLSAAITGLGKRAFVYRELL